MAKFPARLPDDLYERVKAYARARSVSVNQVLIEALEEELRVHRMRETVARMREFQRFAPRSGESVSILRQLREERSGLPR